MANVEVMKLVRVSQLANVEVVGLSELANVEVAGLAMGLALA